VVVAGDVVDGGPARGLDLGSTDGSSFLIIFNSELSVVRMSRVFSLLKASL